VNPRNLNHRISDFYLKKIEITFRLDYNFTWRRQ
jgi:hypothetical protein